jgi:hypothetical protein
MSKTESLRKYQEKRHSSGQESRQLGDSICSRKRNDVKHSVKSPAITTASDITARITRIETRHHDRHGWWHQVKQVASYQVEIADPAVALAAVVHARPVDHPCRLTLELAPDPVRDAVLVDYGLSGVDGQEYVLLASHLQQHPAGNASGEYTGGSDNTAWWPDCLVASGSLFAQGVGRSRCLSAAPGFSQASTGYFGSSDLWQDVSQHQAMTWNFTSAGPGFVVLGAEFAAASGVVALTFAANPTTAADLAAQSLAAGIDAARTAVVTA